GGAANREDWPQPLGIEAKPQSLLSSWPGSTRPSAIFRPAQGDVRYPFLPEGSIAGPRVKPEDDKAIHSWRVHPDVRCTCLRQSVQPPRLPFPLPSLSPDTPSTDTRP